MLSENQLDWLRDKKEEDGEDEERRGDTSNETWKEGKTNKKAEEKKESSGSSLWGRRAIIRKNKNGRETARVGVVSPPFFVSSSLLSKSSRTLPSSLSVVYRVKAARGSPAVSRESTS